MKMFTPLRLPAGDRDDNWPNSTEVKLEGSQSQYDQTAVKS